MENVQEDIDKFMDEEKESGENSWEMENSAEKRQSQENVQIYTDADEDKQFFSNQMQDQNIREHKEEEIFRKNENSVLQTNQDNQRTVENNYIKGNTGQYQEMNEQIFRQGDEINRSQRTEVKHPIDQQRNERITFGVPMVNERAKPKMIPIHQENYSTQKKGAILLPESFGEVAYEAPIFENNMMLTENISKARETIIPYKAKQTWPNVEVSNSKKSENNFGKMFTMNMNSMGIVDNNSNSSHPEKRLLKFLDVNQIEAVSMNEKSYEKYRDEYMAKEEQDEGFKTRIRKGKTLNVYIKNQEEKTPKKPSYIEMLGKKVKERARNNSNHHEIQTRNFPNNISSERMKSSNFPKNFVSPVTNQHLKIENLDENFGSTKLSDQSETIVRIREGNSYTTRKTRGGISELKEYIGQIKRDSIGPGNEDEQITGAIIKLNSNRRSRTQSENKQWRMTAKSRGRKDHWDLGNFQEMNKGGRKTASTDMHKTLSGILNSLNKYNKKIIEVNQIKKKEILDNNKIMRETLEHHEQEQKIREEFYKMRSSNYSMDNKIHFNRKKMNNNRFSFSDSKERTLMSFMTQQKNKNNRGNYENNNAYGEYFNSRVSEREYPKRTTHSTYYNGGNMRESSETRERSRYEEIQRNQEIKKNYNPYSEYGRNSEHERRRGNPRRNSCYQTYRGNSRIQGNSNCFERNSQYQNRNGEMESFRASSQNRILFNSQNNFDNNQEQERSYYLPNKNPRAELQVVYQKANIDSHKRIKNINEYYNDYFDRAQQRKENSKKRSFNHKRESRSERNTMHFVRDSIGNKYIQGNSRQFFEEDKESFKRDSGFSGNKYMSTISMNQENRLSANDYDKERFIKKFGQAQAHWEEKVKNFGNYQNVDARSHKRSQKMLNSEIKYGRNPFNPEIKNTFESFQNSRNNFFKNSSRSQNSSYSKRTKNKLPFLISKEEKVTRRVLPTRHLKNMKMNSKGNLVKMPLAQKLKRKFNINHFDKKNKSRQKMTHLSYGVKGHIRVRETSAPMKKKKMAKTSNPKRIYARRKKQ